MGPVAGVLGIWTEAVGQVSVSRVKAWVVQGQRVAEAAGWVGSGSWKCLRHLLYYGALQPFLVGHQALVDDLRSSSEDGFASEALKPVLPFAVVGHKAPVAVETVTVSKPGAVLDAGGERRVLCQGTSEATKMPDP